MSLFECVLHAVVSILLVGRRQFLGRDGQIEFLCMADNRNLRRDPDRRSQKVPVQRINSRNGLVLECHNNIALSQTSAAGGTSRLKTNDQDATIQWQPVKADHPRVNGHVLTSHSDPTTPDTTSLINQAATNSAVLLAMAKQIPCAGRIMAVLTPMICPPELTSGPPELPGFKAASVWMTLSMSRPD